MTERWLPSMGIRIPQELSATWKVRPRRWEWVPTVAGVLISSGIGAFFYFRTDAKAAFATFAGLLGTAIALQVEMILQSRGRADVQTRQQEMIADIESTSWLPETLEKLLSSVRVVERIYGDTMVPRLAHEAFEDCLGRIRSLQRGHYETPYGDMLLMYALLEQARESVLATSVSSDDLAWWSSPHGETYLRLHCEAMRRGVSIQRIFIYDRWTEKHERLARMQHEHGVKMLCVKRSELPPELRLEVIIWDRRVGYEARLNSVGETIVNHYTFAEQDVGVMLNQYRMMESCAKPWVPAAGIVGGDVDTPDASATAI